MAPCLSVWDIPASPSLPARRVLRSGADAPLTTLPAAAAAYGTASPTPLATTPNNTTAAMIATAASRAAESSSCVCSSKGKGKAKAAPSSNQASGSGSGTATGAASGSGSGSAAASGKFCSLFSNLVYFTVSYFTFLLVFSCFSVESFLFGCKQAETYITFLFCILRSCN
jgi:hypothetical protein